MKELMAILVLLCVSSTAPCTAHGDRLD